MLDNAVIWDWIESLETETAPTVRSPSPQPLPRPAKRARRNDDHHHATATAADHVYDPALPQTPPGTSSIMTARGQTDHSR